MKNTLSIAFLFCHALFLYGHPDKVFECKDERPVQKKCFCNDTIPEYYQFGIDKNTGDTIREYRASSRFLRTTTEGVNIVDGYKLGGMGSACGCEPRPHGYWIERYRNGHLKSQGSYYCNRKIGTWTHYYEGGQIYRVETYKTAYAELFTKWKMPWSNVENAILLEGPYLEYYPNGKLKTQGNYEIIEEYSTTDTSYTIDYDTYELIPKVETGEFWLPKSKKVGIWTAYDGDGQLISEENYRNPTWETEQIRSIDDRYWELIQETAKQIEGKE